MFDDLTLFLHIARRRSLSAAAMDLGLPAATVTRRLQRLEERLGCRLVHRSARRFELTAEGMGYVDALDEPVARMEDTVRRLEADQKALSGPLTIFAPTNISLGLLHPMWSAFAKAYPEITLDLQLSNENKDILSGRADLALRIGPQADSQLTQRKIGSVSTILVAAPEYLAEHGNPARPKDLSAHRLIAIDAWPNWALSRSDPKAAEAVRPSPVMRVDDISLATKLVRDGVGISLLPISELGAGLARGDLVRILPDWQGHRRDAFCVWPSGRLLTARARCLRDFIIDYVRRIPELQTDLD